MRGSDVIASLNVIDVSLRLLFFQANRFMLSVVVFGRSSLGHRDLHSPSASACASAIANVFLFFHLFEEFIDHIAVLQLG